MTFAGIELGNTYGIEIEFVFIRFCKPENSLVPPGKAFGRMKSEIEAPDNSISKVQASPFETVVSVDIERINFAVFYVCSNLPTNAASICEVERQSPR